MTEWECRISEQSMEPFSNPILKVDYTQYFVITYKEKESGKKKYIYMCITESLCRIPEMNTTL